MTTSLRNLLEYCYKPSTYDEMTNLPDLLKKSIFVEVDHYAKKNSDHLQYVSSEISKNLSQMDIYKACAVAVFYNSLVEYSGNTTCGYAFIDLFANVVILAYDYFAKISNYFNISEKDVINYISEKDMESIFEKFNKQTKAFLGCEYLANAVTSVITRDNDCRDYFKSKQIFTYANYLQRYIYYINYTVKMYNTCSYTKILVICPSIKKGFYILVNDISNCYHLFTLLELEMYRCGYNDIYNMYNYNYDDNIYKTATGKNILKTNNLIKAHFNYYTYDALLNVNDSHKDAFLMNGKLSVEYIPAYMDTQILVIEPTVATDICWRDNYIIKGHVILKPSLEILDAVDKTYIAQLKNNINYFW